MADEILRSKHAFGSSENLEQAIADGKIDAYDLVMLDGETDNPKFGWIDKNGNPVILKDKEGLSEEEVDAKVDTAIKENNADIDTKVEDAVADAKNYADEQIMSVKSSLNNYLVEKYEITDAPVGTLVNYYEREIRVMCPANSVWNKQNVGTGGDPNTYYVTFKTFAPSDDAVGYIEHLGDQVDSEILTDVKTDANGLRYQPTWLGVAKYDEATDAWSYYGAQSGEGKFIGWDYQIDWYNADGIMIASDCVRINLSNEDCHSNNIPSYVSSVVADANAYTDEKIAALENAYTVVEF